MYLDSTDLQIDQGAERSAIERLAGFAYGAQLHHGCLFRSFIRVRASRCIASNCCSSSAVMARRSAGHYRFGMGHVAAAPQRRGNWAKSLSSTIGRPTGKRWWRS